MAKVLFALFLAGVMLLEPDVAASQTYPARQVHMIVTFPPGGNADTIARLVADKLTQNLRQSVIVENKPGAASIVGTAAVAQAPADGHTLLQAGTNISTNPALGHKTSYDAERDLEPVALLVTVPAVIVVHRSLPVNTLAELVVHAKSRPGEVNYGSAGNGSFPHLAVEKLAQETGIKMTHVPFRGFGPALIGLLRNDVNVLASDIPGALEHVRAGKLRALAVAARGSDRRRGGRAGIRRGGVPRDHGARGHPARCDRCAQSRDQSRSGEPRDRQPHRHQRSRRRRRRARGLRRVSQAGQGDLDQGHRHRRHQGGVMQTSVCAGHGTLVARNVMRAGLWPIFAGARRGENPAAVSFFATTASP